MKFAHYINLVFLLTLSACASRHDPALRTQNIDETAQRAQWQAQDIYAGDFAFRTYAPVHAPYSTHTTAQAPNMIRIYIEGDGLAWLNRYTPSSNPTPITPTAFNMARGDTQMRVIYMGRVCQYISTAACDNRAWWTDKRFAPEVIAATSTAIDQIKAKYNADRVELVGYSGGGVIAGLLAAQRGDVSQFITVASPMDTQKWVTHHKISPLSGSLNPADYGQALSRVKQRHFVGGQDKIVPESVVRSYANGINAPVQVINDYSHSCCWAENWPTHIDLIESREARFD